MKYSKNCLKDKLNSVNILRHDDGEATVFSDIKFTIWLNIEEWAQHKKYAGHICCMYHSVKLMEF